MLQEGAISRHQLACRLGGNRARALQRVDAAIATGAGSVGTGDVRAKGGKVRSALLVYPSPVVPSDDEEIDNLAALLENARVSQAELARRLGRSQSLVAHWLAGTQRMPSWAPAQIRAAIAESPPPRAMPPDRRSEVLKAVRQFEGAHDHGPSKAELARRLEGAPSVGKAVDQLLAEGDRLFHGVWFNKTDKRRSIRALTTHRPAQVQAPKTATLKSERLRVCWTQKNVATRLGLPESTVSRWERELDVVPPWAAAPVSDLLEQWRGTDSVTERAELVERRLGEHLEGIGEKELRRVHGWNDLLQVNAEELLFAQGRAHFEYSGVKGGRRRLFIGPPPPGDAPSADELAALLERSGRYQREVAEALGWKQGDVSALLLGRRRPPRARLEELARFLSDEAQCLEADGRAAAADAPSPGEFSRRLGAHRASALFNQGLVYVVQAVNDGTGRARNEVRWGKKPRAGGRRFDGGKLAHGRRAAGLSQAELGRRLGTNGGTAASWEASVVPPYRVADVEAVLAAAGVAAQPRTDPVRAGQAELEQFFLEVVTQHPDLSATQLVPLLRGSAQRQRQTLEALAARGLLSKRPERYRDSLGRSQTRVVWHRAGRHPR